MPASPVTLPTVQQPARTAPPVVESLSFLHSRALSEDAHRVLARRIGRPQRAAARQPSESGAGGQVRSDSGKNSVNPVLNLVTVILDLLVLSFLSRWAGAPALLAASLSAFRDGIGRKFKNAPIANRCHLILN